LIAHFFHTIAVIYTSMFTVRIVNVAAHQSAPAASEVAWAGRFQIALARKCAACASEVEE
jgi:hypothetical protein